MRDGIIVQEFQKNAKRDALLFSQFEFMQCRNEALERVLCVSKWHDRVKWLFNPDAFFKIVDAVQWNLLAAKRKARAEEAAKPKIDVVGAVQ